MTLRIKITLALIVIALLGSGAIVYMGRPVISLKKQRYQEQQDSPSSLPDYGAAEQATKENKTEEQPKGEQPEEQRAVPLKIKKTDAATTKSAAQTPKKQDSEVTTAQQQVQSENQAVQVSQQEQSEQNVSQTEQSAQKSGALTFTMSDVAAHSSSSDCWATINGNVYDLTSWISRHPGGPERIIQLCGVDGSQKFSAKHESSLRAEQALILLKIGTLE